MVPLHTSPLSTPKASILPTPSAPPPTPTSQPTVTPTAFPPVIVAQKGGEAGPADRWDVELISHVQTVGAAMDVAVSGDYAYVADAEVGLQVVDLAALSGLAGSAATEAGPPRRKAPGLGMRVDPHRRVGPAVEPLPGKGVRARRLALQDDLAYLVGWGALQVVDISDPEAPQVVGLLPIEDGAAALDVAVVGDHAYVAGGRGGVRVIDVSDPAAPTEVSAFVPDDVYVGGLAAAGDSLYAAASGAGLIVVDVSNPRHPVELARHATPLPAWDVEVFVNWLFVSWNLRGAAGGPARACGSGVTVLDVRPREAPETMGTYCDPGREGVADVAFADGIMIAAAGERGVRVLDTANWSAPIEVGFYDTPGDAVRVVMKGNRLYVADREGGLFILRFTPNGFPANEDGTIRVGISQPSYALRERIEVELVMLAERVMLQGACDWWFERETARGWERVGSCPKSALTDEPTWHQRGERVRISLPTSDTDNVYTYSYNLTPGVYRYVQRYGTRGGSSMCPSPPFEIVAD
jgi:hypothetical protein